MELKNKKAVYCNTMLQFDANAHANADASVNKPLNFHGDVDANTNADVKSERTFSTIYGCKRLTICYGKLSNTGIYFEHII